nr:MAG TPA: hypothetical protein [Caudoviricetes sp.]
MIRKQENSHRLLVLLIESLRLIIRDIRYRVYRILN